MASELRVNTLKDASGNNSVATSTVAQGSAKAWIVTADGSSIDGGFNISTLDDDGAGDFGLHFTSSFDSANYAITAAAQDNTSNVLSWHCDVSKNTQAAGSVDLEQYYNNSSSVRNMTDEKAFVTTHGDLA